MARHIPTPDAYPCSTFLIPVLIFDKDFKINHLDQRHLHLPITHIDICVNLNFQGVCDERPDLGIFHDITSLDIKEEPRRANHFSFRFGFGGSEAVMLDVTRPGCDFSPWIAKKYNSRTTPASVPSSGFRQRRSLPTKPSR